MPESLWIPSWQEEDVEIKENNSVYEGFFHVHRLVLRHRCFSGAWSPWLTREQIRRADAAAVLLLDPLEHKLVMIEQFRMGLVDVGCTQSPWLLEIVAGLLEPEESPEQAIKREAREEAGCEITQLFKIGVFYNTPGGFSEKTSLYCGVTNAALAGGIYGQACEHEDIRVHVVPTQWALTALEEGKLITSASTLIALQWLKLHRQQGTLTAFLENKKDTGTF